MTLRGLKCIDVLMFRYNMSGEVMPFFRPWFEKNLGVDLDHRTPSQLRSDLVVPPAVVNQPFINFLKANNIGYSNAPQHRVVRSHGHTGILQ